MPIKASTAREVGRLLEDLEAEGPQRDAAVARLSMIGPRAVARLVEHVRSTPSAGARIAGLRALEAIGDPRALDPAAEAIAEPDGRTAGAAVAILRLFVTSRDNDLSMRAIDRLTAAALDSRRPDAVRAAAIDALRLLPDEVTAPLFERLGTGGHDRGKADATAALKRAVPTLEVLAAEGPLGDPDALRARAPEMRDAAIATLHRLIGRLHQQEAATADQTDRARWATVRAAVHQVLASRGSRVALYDLRETLETGDPGMLIGFLAAVRAIGDALCLDALGAAHAKAEDTWWQAQLRETLHQVIDREGLTRRHAAVRRLEARHPGLLSTPSQTSRPTPRAGRT